MKTQSILKVSAIAGVLIALYGCNNDGMFTDTLSNIDHLQVSALNVPLGEFNAGDQVAVGYPLQYQATLVYNDGTPSEDVTDSVSWQSSNAAIASVDDKGVALGESIGDTSLIAQWKEFKSNAAPLFVTDATATALTLSGREATIKGIPIALSATAIFNDGTQQNLSSFVTWQSSNTSVGDFTHATQPHWLVPVGAGKTQISATYSVTELSSSTPLTETVLSTAAVDPDTPAYLSLNPSYTTLTLGSATLYQVMLKINTIDTAPQVAPFNITPYLTFNSSDSNVVSLEATTNDDGQDAILARALAVSDGLTITASGTLNGTTYTRSGTLVVSDSVASTLTVDCGDATIVEGIDLTCSATITEDSQLRDVTSSVSWSSSDTSVMTASTTTPGRFTGVTAGTATATASASDGTLSANASITITDNIISAITITNIETSVNSGETLQMIAQGTTLTGGEDVTSRVIWRVDDAGSMFSDTTPGLLTAESGLDADKMVTVTASLDASIAEANTALTLKNALLYACGTGVDDTDSTSGLGECLKIATGTSGAWFTSTPNIIVVDALGYTLDNSEINSGDTYASSWVEDGSYGPDGGEFIGFRQDGDGVLSPPDGGSGVDGQFDRWCQKLTLLNFAGRTNWRRPTADELVDVYNLHGRMWENQGWPGFGVYWSATEDGAGSYNIVNLLEGINTGGMYLTTGLYVSCISSD